MINIIRSAGKKGIESAKGLNISKGVFFWDNNPRRWGEKNEYGEVISFARIQEIIGYSNDYRVIIPSFLANSKTKEDCEALGIDIHNAFVYVGGGRPYKI